MTFGENLKALRKERGLTQEEFAKQSGVSRSAIGMYESGKREPSFETLELFSDFFNVDMNKLLGQEPPAAPPSAQEAAEPYKAPLTKRDELTEHEREHIELYRELDERGRNAVDDLTDLHVERVRESTERSSSSTGTEIADEKQA